MTVQEKLEWWKQSYAYFRQQTPSAPDWFNAIDQMVGAMVADHIADLESKLPSRD